jgi:hypothetical protein
MSDECRCQNCGTSPSRRRPFLRKDWCRECFKISKYLKDVEAWKFERPETWKHFPRSCSVPSSPYSKEEFLKYKSRLIRELKNELVYLRCREAKRRDARLTDGLTIEKKLGSILDLLRWKVRNRNVFHGIATPIDHCFNQEQRRVLFGLLDDIEDQVYWPIKHARKELWCRAFREETRASR